MQKLNKEGCTTTSIEDFVSVLNLKVTLVDSFICYEAQKGVGQVLILKKAKY